MSETTERSDLEQSRFPVIVLAITMLAPIIVAIGLVIHEVGKEPVVSQRRQESSLPDEIPAGSIRLTVTAPGMMRGTISVSRLDAAGEKVETLELAVRSGLASGDLALGDPPFEILIESERHEPRRAKAELRRLTLMLVEKD